jgi:hypothetical protein
VGARAIQTRLFSQTALLLAILLANGACSKLPEAEQAASLNYAAVCENITIEAYRQNCERNVKEMESRREELRKQLPPPEAYLRSEDQERARQLDPDNFPCSFIQHDGGHPAVAALPTDECVRMLPRQRYSGVWINEFEGSQFYPDRVTYPKTRDTTIWLDVENVALGGLDPDGRGYLVVFEGRRTMHPGLYGHLGSARHELIVDEVVSVRPLAAPAR